MKKGWLLGGLAVAVATLLLLLFLKAREKTPSPAANAPGVAKPTAAPADAPTSPAPVRPSGPRAVSTPDPPPGTAPPPPPTPEDTDNPAPPPLTGLILTFPEGVTDQVVQEHYAKCQVNELRRSGNFAKVMPKDGVSVDEVKKCFQFTEVGIGEERGGPPPGAR